MILSIINWYLIPVPAYIMSDILISPGICTMENYGRLWDQTELRHAYIHPRFLRFCLNLDGVDLA